MHGHFTKKQIRTQHFDDSFKPHPHKASELSL
nr:MAG TPA: hypothetical protein [Caudoviricetes sp.]